MNTPNKRTRYIDEDEDRRERAKEDRRALRSMDMGSVARVDRGLISAVHAYHEMRAE